MSSWPRVRCSSVRGSQTFKPWTTRQPSITPLLLRLNFCERFPRADLWTSRDHDPRWAPPTRKGLSLRRGAKYDGMATVLETLDRRPSHCLADRLAIVCGVVSSCTRQLGSPLIVVDTIHQGADSLHDVSVDIMVCDAINVGGGWQPQIHRSLLSAACLPSGAVII